MLKMLRHDLKSVWKIWCIMAPLALLAGILGGAAVCLLNSDLEEIVPDSISWILYLTSTLVTAYWPMILTAFILVTLILIVVRYYKNFYTDEGYLTFTLPVSRVQLLNSKILMAFIWMAATVAVCIAAYFAFSVISSIGTGAVDPEFDVDYIIPEEDTLFGKYGLLFFLLEIIVLAVVATAADILLLFLCVTLGAVIVKRAKLILGLGIYYGINSLIGGLIYAFFIGIMILLVVVVGDAADSDTTLLFAQIAIYGTPAMGIALFGALGVGSYWLNLKLVKEKLNLP